MRIKGLEFRIQNSFFWILDFEFWIYLFAYFWGYISKLLYATGLGGRFGSPMAILNLTLCSGRVTGICTRPSSPSMALTNCPTRPHANEVALPSSSKASTATIILPIRSWMYPLIQNEMLMSFAQVLSMGSSYKNKVSLLHPLNTPCSLLSQVWF